MLSFQGQVMESIFIDSICGLVFLDEWFYLSNRSINCVNFGTSLNLVHSNLGGSKQSRMLRAINQEDALYICNDHTLIYVWFYFKLWYGMYILTCLKSISLSWGDVVSYQQTCSENNSCWSSGAYDSWYWALLLMTLIFWFWCSTSTLVQRRPVGDAFQNGKVCTMSNVDLGAE